MPRKVFEKFGFCCNIILYNNRDCQLRTSYRIYLNEIKSINVSLVSLNEERVRTTNSSPSTLALSSFTDKTLNKLVMVTAEIET